MRVLSTHRHRIAAVATAATLVLGGGTAAVVAATTSPAAAGTVSLTATNTSAATATHAARHHARGLLARTDHATVELKVKGQWVTYDLDRGKVTAVSATSITLARPDGQSVTLAIAGTTRFGPKTASASAITVGARATVISEGGTARRVVQAVHHAAKAATSSTSTAA